MAVQLASGSQLKQPVTKSCRHLICSWLRDDGWCKWVACAGHYLGGGWLCRVVEGGSGQLHDHQSWLQDLNQEIQICNCSSSHLKRAPTALKQRERVWGKGSFSYALGESIVLWFRKQFCLVRVINTSQEMIPVTSCVLVALLFLYSTMFF